MRAERLHAINEKRQKRRSRQFNSCPKRDLYISNHYGDYGKESSASSYMYSVRNRRQSQSFFWKPGLPTCTTTLGETPSCAREHRKVKRQNTDAGDPEAGRCAQRLSATL